jgi:hypothetical protein
MSALRRRPAAREARRPLPQHLLRHIPKKKGARAMLDWQCIEDPAYNADRKPMTVGSPQQHA